MDDSICKCYSNFGKYNEGYLICQICKSSIQVTVCDTSHNGFVCADELCQTALRNTSVMLDDDIVNPGIVKFQVSVKRNAKTHVFEMVVADDTIPLPTPDYLAFMYLERHGILVLPQHEYTITMSFANIDKMVVFDEQLDTIYMKFSKPLVNTICDDGITRTTCHEWDVQCLPNSNIQMCQAIPLRSVGRHRITMDISPMIRIGKEGGGWSC